MGITKFGINIAEHTARFVKSNGLKSILEVKPYNKPLNVKGLQMAPPLSSDVVEISRVKPFEMVPENEQLFSWASPHPKLSFEKIEPESLAMVHMTNYYPKGGKILSTKLASRDVNGVAAFRPTIHFALNKSVTEHALGYGWQTMDYAVILPFKETVKSMPSSKVIGGIQDDFFFLDEVRLPIGSTIIKYNPEIAPHQLKVSDAFEGIRLIESSNRNLGETADIVLRKMGYNHYNDAFMAHLGASESDIKLLTTIPEANLAEYITLVNKNGGVNAQRKVIEEAQKTQKEYADLLSEEDYKKVMDNYSTNLKFCDLLEKYGDKIDDFPKAWQTFCKENNYINKLHTQTPWAKAEMTLFAINMLKTYGKNTWGENFKQRLLSALESIPKELPKGKDAGLDITKLRKIVAESNTPEMAEKRIADEMKLKAMPPRETTTFEPDEDSSALVDFTLQMFGM